ncbi:MAG: 30S ribosomal protein S7 [Patescibacteria group bacterium]
MRGKKAPVRMIIGDGKFGNVMVAKFINYLMYDGKKSTAEAVVYSAFEVIADKTKKDPVEVFEEAIKKVMPTLEVKSRRVGGANYQIPIPVRNERRLFLGCKWVLEAARTKKGRPMHLRLADELIAASEGTGDAFKKKADVQRMAEANRAFAHFAR